MRDTGFEPVTSSVSGKRATTAPIALTGKYSTAAEGLRQICWAGFGVSFLSRQVGLSIYLSAGAAGGECRVCISIVVACGYAAAIENPRFFGTEDSLFLA